MNYSSNCSSFCVKIFISSSLKNCYLLFIYFLLILFTLVIYYKITQCKYKYNFIFYLYYYNLQFLTNTLINSLNVTKLSLNYSGMPLKITGDSFIKYNIEQV